MWQNMHFITPVNCVIQRFNDVNSFKKIPICDLKLGQLYNVQSNVKALMSFHKGLMIKQQFVNTVKSYFKSFVL